ncbi:MAG: exo-rhamnogalacturonan lyase family protein [Armatimonadota bacterium]
MKFVLSAVLLISMHAAACAADSFSPLAVTLTITNPGPARQAWPITSGVPLPRTATYDGVHPITTVSNLRLYQGDGATMVPAQFRVLSRWDGELTDGSKRIRWVLVDFQTDLPSAGRKHFILKGVPDGGTSGGSIQVDNSSPQYVEVNTGAITFRVSKSGFNLFDYVQRSGDVSPIVTGSVSNGAAIKTQSDTAEINSSAGGSNYEVVVEEPGPWRTVVRVRGFYKPTPYMGHPYYLGYTARIHAYSGKDWVRVTYTLENSGQPYYGGGARSCDVVFIDKLHLRLTLDGLADDPTVTFEGYSSALSAGDRCKFEQTHSLVDPADESKNFSFASYKDSGSGYTMVGQGGKRAVGWADLSDGSRGLTVAMRWFWQNYPKAFYAYGKTLEVGLFPEGLGDADGVDGVMTTSGPVPGKRYRFLGGYWKTHDLLYWFHGPDASARDGLVAAFQEPLLAIPSAEWVDYTRALPGHGRLCGRGAWQPSGGDPSSTPDDPQRVRADLAYVLERYEQFLMARWDYTKAQNPGGGRYGSDDGLYQLYCPDDPSHGLAERRAGNGWGKVDWYGWEDFGDITWIDHHNHLGYDWVWSCLLHLIRTGDAAWWSLARQMAVHNTDIDLVHAIKSPRRPVVWYVKNGDVWVERWEYDAHDKKWDGQVVGKWSHTWNKGRTLYYLLTGEELYGECAKFVAMAQADWVTNPSRLASLSLTARETRWQGWVCEGILSAYTITGDPSLLSAAVGAFKSIVSKEHIVDGVPCGHTYNPDGGGTALATCDTYYAVPLIDLYYNLPDGQDRAAVREYLLRVAHWVRDRYIYGGDMDGSNYRPLRGALGWPESGTSKGHTQNLWLTADLLAWAWRETGDDAFIQKAEKVFRDGIIWWQYRYVESGDPPSVSPTSRSPLYLSWTQQQAKEPGKFQRSFHYFMAVERDRERMRHFSAPSPSDLTLSFRLDPAQPQPGSTALCSVVFSNPGVMTAANTIIFVPLPSGAAYVEGSAALNGVPIGSVSAAQGRIQIPIGTVAPGASGTVTLQIRM